MDRSEKRHRKKQQRLLNKQRKAYLQEERKSLKRKKREEKKLAIKRRKKHQGTFLSFLFGIFSKRSRKQKSETIHRRVSWRKRLKNFREERRSRRRQKKEMARQRKESIALRAQYYKEERHSIKKVDYGQSEQNQPMRKKIRQNRIQFWKMRWKEFFRKPVKSKKRSKEQKMIRQRIKRENRQQLRKNFMSFPGRFRNGILNFFRRREQRFKYNTQGIKRGLSDFGGFWRTREQRIELLKVLINSTTLYLFAFGFIYYLSQLVTIFTAKFYDIPSVLYSYRIFWPLYTYSSLYTRPALILIFGTGPLIALLVTFGSYRLFLVSRRFRYNLKVLFLWIIFHGLNSFFGAYIAGVITRTGFVYSTEWIFLSNVFDVEEIIFLIVSIVVLITAGVFFTRLHLTSASSGVLIERKTRLYFIISQVFLPGLFGVAILFGVNYPKNPPELLLLYGASFLMIIPVLTNYNSPSNEMVNRSAKNFRVSIGWIYIFFVIILLIFLRSGLFSGVSFG